VKCTFSSREVPGVRKPAIRDDNNDNSDNNNNSSNNSARKFFIRPVNEIHRTYFGTAI